MGADKWFSLREFFLADGNWERYLRAHPEVPEWAVHEVKRFLGCCDPEHGYKKYYCPNCGWERVVAFRCKSRFCPRCGKHHADKWAEQLAETMYRVPHRHMVFTMPAALWGYFRDEWLLFRVLRECAANAVRETIRTCRKDKNRELTIGMICVLHPYGRALNRNPHVHALVTEGGLDADLNWVSNPYFPYEVLRKAWQAQLLQAIEREVKKSGNLLKYGVTERIEELFERYEDGFYVFAKDTVKDPGKAARYVGRYVRHPAIAESRICGYDGNHITFWYERDKKKRYRTMSADRFIGALLSHIPPRNFKLVGYFGLYARSCSKEKKAKAASLNETGGTPRKFRQVPLDRCAGMDWDDGRDASKPVNCDKCGTEMELVEIWIEGRGFIYQKDLDVSWPVNSLGTGEAD